MSYYIVNFRVNSFGWVSYYFSACLIKTFRPAAIATVFFTVVVSILNIIITFGSVHTQLI